MTENPARRFYKEAAAASATPPDAGPFTVTLDGRPVKTPGAKPLTLPTNALALAVAEEWQAQDETIKPTSMPMMQLACTALDRVGAERDAVAARIADFGNADLLCYRATEPADLVARQTDAWQPILDWLADELGAALNVTSGITHIAQPAESLAALADVLAAYDEFELTVVAEIAQVYSSLGLALAVERGRLDRDEALSAAWIDEAFQNEQWGEDHEAMDRRRNLKADADAAVRFLSLCREC